MTNEPCWTKREEESLSQPNCATKLLDQRKSLLSSPYFIRYRSHSFSAVNLSSKSLSNPHHHSIFWIKRKSALARQFDSHVPPPRPATEPSFPCSVREEEIEKTNPEASLPG